MLLHAVVQVALEAPSFRQPGLDDAGTRGADLLQFGARGAGGLKLGVLQGQPAGLHRGVEQPPVPGQRRVGQHDRDRGARLGADELDHAIAWLPVGSPAAPTLWSAPRAGVSSRERSPAGPAAERSSTSRVGSRRAARSAWRTALTSAPVESSAVSPVMACSSRARWVAVTPNASGTVKSTTLSTR